MWHHSIEQNSKVADVAPPPSQRDVPLVHHVSPFSCRGNSIIKDTIYFYLQRFESSKTRPLIIIIMLIIIIVSFNNVYCCTVQLGKYFMQTILEWNLQLCKNVRIQMLKIYVVVTSGEAVLFECHMCCVDQSCLCPRRSR